MLVTTVVETNRFYPTSLPHEINIIQGVINTTKLSPELDDEMYTDRLQETLFHVRHMTFLDLNAPAISKKVCQPIKPEKTG